MKINKKGISLIVLIITILVMMIIAAAIILYLDDTKVVNNATNAVTANNLSIAKEVMVVAKTDWNSKQKDLIEEGYYSFEMYAEQRLKDAGFEIGTNGGQLDVSEYGQLYTYVQPIIPEGFIASTLEGEDEVAEGLVIYEGDETVTENDKTTRNQFVWVPVPNMSEFVRNDRSGSSEPYSLITAANDLTGEYAEYNAMKASVAKYGGFYIARYEAGKDGTTVVSKKSATVWNKIHWGTSMTEVGTEGAVYRARQMYNDSQSVVSTLCYGVQWDAALKFMKDVENPYVSGEKYINNSTGMGWYGVESIHSAGEDIDENSSNKVKNVYDMAGNAQEWTMESISESKSNSRVMRGGYYGIENEKYNIHSVSFCVAYSAYHIDAPAFGFRVALYLK